MYMYVSELISIYLKVSWDDNKPEQNALGNVEKVDPIIYCRVWK